MWWSRALLVLALAGCGFAPAYAPGGPARALFGQVDVAPPGDRYSFDLAQRLEERLGDAQGPSYKLTYRIQTTEQGLGVTPGNAITRYHAIGLVDYTLTDLAGTVVSSGRVESFAGYSAAGTTVSAEAAREDAYERLMRMLADEVFNRLVADTAKKP